MENDDQTLEGGGSETPIELELESMTQTESGITGGDPLDDIQDETARAEAKKWRAIARRHEKKPEASTEVAPVATPTSQEFLTKADFHKSNERKAIREATADAEVKANWSEIVQFYTPRRGKETPEDIKEDIQDAITLFNARKPVVQTDDSKNQITATPVVKTGGGNTASSTPKASEPPNFKLPAGPKDWYKK